MDDITPDQENAIKALLETMEKSKQFDMKCIICSDMTRDRGLVCTGPAPSVPILIGICYPCKHLPDFENAVRQRVREFLIEQGRYDLLEGEGGEIDEDDKNGYF